MKLFTKKQYHQLLKNGANRKQNHSPVVKLFTPEGHAIWLLSEIDPNDTNIAFGLCDLGFGTPELGSVAISELLHIRTKHLNLPIERDKFFESQYKIDVYALASRQQGRITEYPKYLEEAQHTIDELNRRPKNDEVKS